MGLSHRDCASAMKSTRRLIICLTALSLTFTRAQTSDVPAAARLRDFEATYLQGLRRIQSPMLGDYLAQLRQLEARASINDIPAVRAEIKRVQDRIAAGTVIDLAATTAVTSQAAPKFIDLLPEKSAGYTPTGRVPESLALGKAEWKIPVLQSGAYKISALYTWPVPTGPVTLRVTIGGVGIKGELPVIKATKSESAFRLFALDTLLLPRDVLNETLTIELISKEPSIFRLQKLLIRKLGKE